VLVFVLDPVTTEDEDDSRRPTMSNSLSRYRSAQRAARALFAPFTAAHCPTCPTPCCVRPARVRPVDVVLVEEMGYRLPPAPLGELVEAPLAGSEGPPAPCGYLGPAGCCFPSDLRPFGCAMFICEPMQRELSADELAAIRTALRRLDVAHADLMAALHAPTDPDSSGPPQERGENDPQ
jgi:hypothetical protein